MQPLPPSVQLKNVVGSSTYAVGCLTNHSWRAIELFTSHTLHFFKTFPSFFEIQCELYNTTLCMNLGFISALPNFLPFSYENSHHHTLLTSIPQEFLLSCLNPCVWLIALLTTLLIPLVLYLHLIVPYHTITNLYHYVLLQYIPLPYHYYTIPYPALPYHTIPYQFHYHYHHQTIYNSVMMD